MERPAPKKKLFPAKKENTSWEKVAPWYDDLLESGDGTYQKDLILPNVRRLLPLTVGETVLDVACGQGFFSREFVKTGAKVIGVDLSASLIEIARKHSPKEIEFMVAPAEAMSAVGASSVDAVACISAIQNFLKPSEVCTEASRVLKVGGRFLIVMNHPAFRVPKRSSWGFDDAKHIQYRRVDEYLSESRSEIVMNPGLGGETKTVSFHHPLQFYFKALAKAGFAVTRLEEWNSQKQSEDGARANAENKSRKEFPLFLALLAVKQ